MRLSSANWASAGPKGQKADESRGTMDGERERERERQRNGLDALSVDFNSSSPGCNFVVVFQKSFSILAGWIHKYHIRTVLERERETKKRE